MSSNPTVFSSQLENLTGFVTMSCGISNPVDKNLQTVTFLSSFCYNSLILIKYVLFFQIDEKKQDAEAG